MHVLYILNAYFEHTTRYFITSVFKNRHNIGFIHPRNVDVIHENRDFYADLANGTVPTHDVLVTNPPYSGDHKERCVDFAAQALASSAIPFLLLMPNYVANKQYFIKATVSSTVNYLVPSQSYEYEHPEGTGHAVPPFFSLWFCGLVADFTVKASSVGTNALCRSVDDLRRLGAAPSDKRLNPAQRRKKKRQREESTN